jgi:hypothetical protein
MEMSDKWVLWLMATLGCVAWGAVILRLIYRLLKTTREPGFSPWPRDIWGAAGRVSLIALAIGTVLLPGGFPDFVLALYPARFWCFLIAALLALIFWLGSPLQRRAAGAATVLVLGGLEVYSVVSVYPSYGWILKGYAAFCLVLSIIVVARRLRPHNAPVMGRS